MQDGTPTSQMFEHVASSVGAEESEEVGVEHLLRDITDKGTGTLTEQLSNQLRSVKSLHGLLCDIQRYLKRVVARELPVNHPILSLLQDALNLLPNLDVEALVRAFTVTTNDEMVTLYTAALVRAIIALHDLINNKAANREYERSTGQADNRTAVDKGAGAAKAADASSASPAAGSAASSSSGAGGAGGAGSGAGGGA